jgi:hypothetical protein
MDYYIKEVEAKQQKFKTKEEINGRFADICRYSTFLVNMGKRQNMAADAIDFIFTKLPEKVSIDGFNHILTTIHKVIDEFNRIASIKVRARRGRAPTKAEEKELGMIRHGKYQELLTIISEHGYVEKQKQKRINAQLATLRKPEPAPEPEPVSSHRIILEPIYMDTDDSDD